MTKGIVLQVYIQSSLFTYDTKKNKEVEKPHRRVNVVSNKGLSQIFLQDLSQWFLVCMNFDIIITGLLVREGGYDWSHVPPPMVSTIEYEVTSWG